jgi:hypothetical protein
MTRWSPPQRNRCSRRRSDADGLTLKSTTRCRRRRCGGVAADAAFELAARVRSWSAARPRCRHGGRAPAASSARCPGRRRPSPAARLETAPSGPPPRCSCGHCCCCPCPGSWRRCRWARWPSIWRRRRWRLLIVCKLNSHYWLPRRSNLKSTQEKKAMLNEAGVSREAY